MRTKIVFTGNHAISGTIQTVLHKYKLTKGNVKDEM